MIKVMTDAFPGLGTVAIDIILSQLQPCGEPHLLKAVRTPLQASGPPD